MLHLFRHIRQSLIMPDNVRKYLLYAVGEILLVVIGILIAVQVNLAMENSRNEDLRQKIVSGLQVEFEQNLAQLDSVIFYQNLVVNSGNQVIDLMYKDLSYAEKQKLDSLISYTTFLWSFDPNDGVLKSSISAGDIHLIHNDSLKVMLFSWESRVLDTREEQNRIMDSYKNDYIPYLRDHIALGDLILGDLVGKINAASGNTDYSSIMNDRVFENLVILQSVNNMDALFELSELHVLIQDILRHLESEKNIEAAG